jgi:hypothetical protein
VNGTWTAPDGTVVTIRPIRAADLELERQFVKGLSRVSGYRRLMSARSPSIDELRRFTDIDPKRELALIATIGADGRERQIGVARYVKSESARDEAEFAIVLSDDWQRRVAGSALTENTAMHALGRKIGFSVSRNRASATVSDLTLDVLTGGSP